MRVGLTLSGDNLTSDGARFAAQLGVTDIVVHLNTYGKGTPEEVAAWQRGEVGPPNAPVIDEPLWDFERMSGVVGMLAEHGLKVAALENFSPRFWSDVLLDGPGKRDQMEGLKRLVRDAGRAGIPVIGYNFLAGRRLGLAPRAGGAGRGVDGRVRYVQDRPCGADPGRHDLEHALSRGRAGRRAGHRLA